MTADSPTAPPQNSADDDLVIDRAFVLSMAQVPFIALAFVVLARIAHLTWASLVPETSQLPNLGPIVVLAFLMILAAAIDGYAFKVPNWLTLPIVVSGWMIGLLHTLDIAFDAGTGGVGDALLGTFIGFILIVPALFIGGMGEGDVKMQMGFGAWIGAYYGPPGMWIVVNAFCAGVIVGGVFGVLIILLRGRFRESAQMYKHIASDLGKIATGEVTEAQQTANARRKDWVRLPYGVPLCVGFVGYLIYKYTLGVG